MAQLTVQQAFDLALQHHRAAKLLEAGEIYEQILARNPEHDGAMNGLAMIALHTGHHELAVELMRQVIVLKPQSAEAHGNLGNALKRKGLIDDAIAAYRRVIALQPTLPGAYGNLGNALREKGQLDEAITACRQESVLRPGAAEAHFNLGAALHANGQFDEAIIAHRRALALRPNYPEAHTNLGCTLRESGRIDEAIAAFGQAIALQADYPDVHHHLSLTLLLRGDFQRGWEKYEWRWKYKDFPSTRWNFTQPQWNGGDLAGRTILLHAEQGFGDAIQFVRYVPLVAARGGKVIFSCRPQLRRLLREIPGIAAWLGPGDAIPPFDVHCPLMSLPLAFGTALESIPASVPYLFPDPKLSETWRARLASRPPALKIGLVWAGSARNKNDRNRSMKLTNFVQPMRIPGVRFFSLQKGEAAAQTRSLAEGTELTDWTGDLNDFADTAALIANLDLVVSVDTAVAHLAGAMGKPVWLIVPFAPDWRWLLNRADSPWYPTMRLFRQPVAGDWKSVILEVTDALIDLAAGTKT